MTERPIVDQNSDPAKGLSLKHALTFYGGHPPVIDANGRDILINYRAYHWKKALGLPGVRELEREAASTRIVFAENLVSRLRAGALSAKGFVAGSPVLVTVPKEWWAGVRLDVEGNSAEAHGVIIRGVLIFSPTEFPEHDAAAATAASEAPPAPVPVRPFDERHARALLIAQKMSRAWKSAPPEKETAVFLGSMFDKIPRQAHREIRRKVWPDIRRGPKTNFAAAKLSTGKPSSA